MRTAIEITDEHRSKLLEAAAKRGEKGSSSITQEALDCYFEAAADRGARVELGIEVLGTLAESAADRLEKDVRQWRRSRR